MSLSAVSLSFGAKRIPKLLTNFLFDILARVFFLFRFYQSCLGVCFFRAKWIQKKRKENCHLRLGRYDEERSSTLMKKEMKFDRSNKKLLKNHLFLFIYLKKKEIGGRIDWNEGISFFLVLLFYQEIQRVWETERKRERESIGYSARRCLVSFSFF